MLTFYLSQLVSPWRWHIKREQDTVKHAEDTCATHVEREKKVELLETLQRISIDGICCIRLELLPPSILAAMPPLVGTTHTGSLCIVGKRGLWHALATNFRWRMRLSYQKLAKEVVEDE